MTVHPRNTIRTFALVCVAFSSAYVIGMGIWITWLIGMTDWCARVVGSAKYADGRPDFAISGCVTVMRDQISGLSRSLLIYAGVIALCLLVLMVIVVAGGRLSFRGNRDGIEGDIAPADAPLAVGAQAAADAAQGVADDLKEGEG